MIGRRFAVMRRPDDAVRRFLQSGFIPIPIGARMAYLPRVTEDRSKRDRFDEYVRYGIFKYE